jgi:peptidoglycan/LPS O-acetylase OafA/YrhL
MLSTRWALVICFAIILLTPFFYPSHILFSEVLTSPLLHEFLSGFVVAFLIEKSYCTPYLHQHKVRLLLIISSFILSILCFCLLDRHFLLKPLGCMLMVFSAALVNFYLNKDNKLIKFLVSLGDFSYSTYLAHTFVLMFYMHYVSSWLQLHPANDMIILSTILYFVSKGSYYLIENRRYVKK